MPETPSEPSAKISAQNEVTESNNVSQRLNTSDSQPNRLEISYIRIDCGTQLRTKLNQGVVDEYAKALREGAIFPPVTVFYDGKDYYLADGFHRLQAAKKLTLTTIAADVRQGNCRDAILYSAGANATHGLRRSNSDKRRAVMTLLRDPEWSLWTNTAIAEVCGVNEGLVRQIKSELSSDNPKIDKNALAKKCGVDLSLLEEAITQVQSLPQERKAQRKGKTYSVNTTKIGKSSKVVASTEKTVPSAENSKTNPTTDIFRSPGAIKNGINDANQREEQSLEKSIASGTSIQNELTSQIASSSTLEICAALIRNLHYLNDSQLEMTWSVCASQLTSESLDLHNWSDEKLKCVIKALKQIIKAAKYELNRRYETE